MALPKIKNPVFSLEVPSTKKEIEFRPFLVKEEKILLIAGESGTTKDIIRAVKQFINNCVLTEDFDIDKLAMFDLEYIFLKIRANSVNNIIEFTVTDEDDGKDYDLSLEEGRGSPNLVMLRRSDGAVNKNEPTSSTPVIS